MHDDSYKKGYAHGCRAALEVYEAKLDDLKRKMAQYVGDAEQHIAEADRVADELRANMAIYIADCERRLTEAAEHHGVKFERLPERKH
jgi:cytochrome c556